MGFLDACPKAYVAESAITGIVTAATETPIPGINFAIIAIDDSFSASNGDVQTKKFLIDNL